MLNLSNPFCASIEMIIGFFILHSYIVVYHALIFMFNHPYLPGLNPTLITVYDPFNLFLNAVRYFVEDQQAGLRVRWLVYLR